MSCEFSTHLIMWFYDAIWKQFLLDILRISEEAEAEKSIVKNALWVETKHFPTHSSSVPLTRFANIHISQHSNPHLRWIIFFFCFHGSAFCSCWWWFQLQTMMQFLKREKGEKCYENFHHHKLVAKQHKSQLWKEKLFALWRDAFVKLNCDDFLPTRCLS